MHRPQNRGRGEVFLACLAQMRASSPQKNFAPASVLLTATCGSSTSSSGSWDESGAAEATKASAVRHRCLVLGAGCSALHDKGVQAGCSALPVGQRSTRLPYKKLRANCCMRSSPSALARFSRSALYKGVLLLGMTKQGASETLSSVAAAVCGAAGFPVACMSDVEGADCAALPVGVSILGLTKLGGSGSGGAVAAAVVDVAADYAAADVAPEAELLTLHSAQPSAAHLLPPLLNPAAYRLHQPQAFPCRQSLACSFHSCVCGDHRSPE